MAGTKQARIEELEAEVEQLQRGLKSRDETYCRQARRLDDASARNLRLLARNEELQKLALHYAEKAWKLQQEVAR